jgi:hypothetical protein
MKNSNEQLQQETVKEPCSEKACATCFEHRGCMYEQFSSVLIYGMDKSNPGHSIDNTNQSIAKRA